MPGQLHLYKDVPLNSASQTDRLDVFTGDGSQTTFALINKLGTRSKFYYTSRCQLLAEVYRLYSKWK